MTSVRSRKGKRTFVSLPRAPQAKSEAIKHKGRKTTAMKTTIRSSLLTIRDLPTVLIYLSLAFIGLVLAERMQAVNPPPDGGYAGGNTAEGQGALLNLTSGTFNTAVGLLSLKSNTDGQFNTAIGAGTLFTNTAGKNTAIGAGALLSNTNGVENTATGSFALLNNSTGTENAAFGANALINSTTGGGNTAIGFNALPNNSTGITNTALGFNAGFGITTADNVIVIGTNVAGQNVDHSCFIGEIFGETASNSAAVFINSDGRLGTVTSSQRFKEMIDPMDKASETLFLLKPVTFRYKKQFDPTGTLQFGLVAEDVANVNPDLVIRGKDGKPYSVRYDQVNAMLLNEFLKEHRKVEQQQAMILELKSTLARQTNDFKVTIGNQQKEIEALTAGLQTISAQVEENVLDKKTVARTQAVRTSKRHSIAPLN
jgi:endosialidase-like protein